MDTLLSQGDGYSLLIQGNYLQSVSALEESIQGTPEELLNYWHLGLAYLLQNEEEAAQLVWLSAISEHEAEDSDAAFQSLVQTLTEEAERLTSTGQFQQSWAVRLHIREFAPKDLTNLLLLVELSIKLEEFTGEFLEESGLIDLLQTDEASLLEPPVLIRILEQVLKFPFPETLRFTEACLPHLSSQQQWSDLVTSAAAEMTYGRRLVLFAIALIELCLQHDPDNTVALGYLPRLLIECYCYPEAVKAAQNFYQRFTAPEIRFFSTCVLLQAMMRAGDWSEISVISDELKKLISDLIRSQSTQLSLGTIQFLILNTALFAYLQDDLAQNRQLQNQASQLFFRNIEVNMPHFIKPRILQKCDTTKRLKIGYIASTFRIHSVGWLSRWLFQHHNREAFEISIYLVQQAPDNEFFETWFAPKIDHYKHLPNNIGDAAKVLRNDELDILVDIDSLTLDFTATVMALKPAPIQVTWLGGDASGLPAIDYFIADPYVLPDNAQDYYQEKIWRLPQTYLAVDGFEVGIPTLRRSDLNIPEDAIIYWSSQVGYKRNPDMVRLQMQILKEVQNSYFLIKGLGDQDIIRHFFIKIAAEEGLSCDHLRFLPLMKDEYTHRANLHIADVALDTYPYNGATTTLETLWAGVPLVTRVGSTFSARNSYAFLKNVGITEGIAWTDEEYINWGVRLGQDKDLRHQVSWKLKQSRHTSPLWNAKQFTHEMENAYRQMWQSYREVTLA
jgi:predicted O-linked N-acetylglucosamine transferase (SPINDLY family)